MKMELLFFLLTAIALGKDTTATNDLALSLAREEAAKPYEQEILSDYIEDYRENSDIIGHIKLEGTDVDCPVFQTIEDYEFYLTHDRNGKDSEQGCIILDPDSEIGIGTKEKGYLQGFEPSTNQLVHGHNMKSGTMFGGLDRYSQIEYADAHPYIIYDSLYEHREYEVVAAVYSQIVPKEKLNPLFTTNQEESLAYYYFNQADTEEEFQAWYQALEAHALYMRDVPLAYGDEMITLSTCSYQVKDGRFAVFGKRIR